MIIRDIRTGTANGHQRLEAVMAYEDSGRPAATAWISSDAGTGPALSLSADPFFLAGVILAAVYGEQRVRVDGPQPCPTLVANAPLWVSCMIKPLPGLRLPRIECGVDRPVPVAGNEGRRTAGYISGGVDSLAMFDHHLRNMPADHPLRIQEALCIFGLYGFDCPGGEPDPARLDAWTQLRNRMEGLLAPYNMPLASLHTNFRSLVDEYATWVSVWPFFHSAIVHACAQRWHMAWMSSSAMGTFTDPEVREASFDSMGSGLVRIEAYGPHEKRFDRVRQLTAWPAAMAILQPCHWVNILPPGQINCGTCNKCVTTRLELTACSAIDKGTSFSGRELMPEDLAGVLAQKSKRLRPRLLDLIEPLERVGMRDLAKVIRKRLEEN